MKKKKLLILIILLIAVAGLTINATSASKKTTGKIYFKDSKFFTEYSVGPKEQDKIFLKYCSKNHDHKKDWGSPGYQTAVFMNNPYLPPSKYHLVSAKIVFIKKTGAIKPFVKKFKADEWEVIGYDAPQGYKPYYAVVNYKYQP